MSQESFVIDLRALARDGRLVQGEVPVSAQSVWPSRCWNRPERWCFRSRGERDDEGKLYVDLHIQAGLVLECQRCLGAWSGLAMCRIVCCSSVPANPLPEDELENDAVGCPRWSR